MIRILQATVFGLALTGCAQLFGLDETSRGDEPPLPGQVSVSVDRLSVGARTIVAPQQLDAALDATWLLPDPTAPDGLRRVMGTRDGARWTAELDAPATVEIELPDATPPFRRHYELPHAAIKVLHGVMEHPNPEPVAADSMVQVSVGLDQPYAGTEGYLLYIAGTWNQLSLVPPAVGGVTLAPPAFRVDAMQSITGRPHERITTADAAVVLRLAGNQLTGVVEFAPVEQTAALALTGTMSAVANDQTLMMTVDQAAVAARFATARPAVADVRMEWGLRAAPGAQYGNDNGPLLNAAVVSPADPTLVTAAYGNPFAARGWPAYLTWSTYARRVVNGREGLPVELNAGMYQRELPRATNDLPLPAGLPELITLDGTPLSTDGMTVPAPARPVEVSFVTDRSDQTAYQIEVFEMVPLGAGLIRRYVVAALGVAPKFTLPADVFAPGGQYTVRAISIVGGYTAIASGDLTQREATIAVAYLDSAMFEVAP